MIKSSFCRICSFWEKRSDTAEYEEWLKFHENTCMSNHQDSSGKMEVDEIREIFTILDIQIILATVIVKLIKQSPIRCRTLLQKRSASTTYRKEKAQDCVSANNKKRDWEAEENLQS